MAADDPRRPLDQVAADVIQQPTSAQFLLKGRIDGSADQAERVGPPRGRRSATPTLPTAWLRSSAADLIQRPVPARVSIKAESGEADRQ